MAAGVAAIGLRLDDTFEISGTESMEGLSILSERLPQASGTSEQILFTASDGDIAAHQQTVEDFVSSASQIDGVSMASDPFSATAPTISDDGAHALVQVQTDSSLGNSAGAASAKAIAVSDTLHQLADTAESSDGSVEVRLGGNIAQSVNVGLSATELVGLVIAAIVLMATFGSVLAAGAPILSALIGVGTGMLGILLVAAVTDVSSTTPILAVMIGLAVGIDYALFIISRAREYLAEGIEPHEAAGRAVATAGSAVVFAGLTVIVALCGLSVAGIAFLTVMGVASAGVVLIAVLVALTVVPALLGLFGTRIAPKKRRSSPGQGRLSRAWISAITRAPALTALVVVAILGAGTLPITGLHLALTDNGFEAKGTEQRDTYDAIADAFGAGYNSPIIVIADIVQTTDPLTVVSDLSSDLSRLDGVERVALGTPNQDGSLAFIEIIPTEGQADAPTMDLVKEIRSQASDLESRYGISDVMVTGRTAVAIDVSDRLNAALVPFGIVVVGLSLILLMIVFRSIAVPVTATVGYLLSLGTGLGSVGAIFGWGWYADALQVTKVGAVISFLPVIVMGVLFGLAMDYEVFLVSRMREEWMRTHDARHAVRAGFLGSSKVVVAAALIMTGVFAAFIPDGNLYIKPIAVGLTVGIAVDAFLVRMALIPALMTLLGEKAWWLPVWLDRLLPVVDIEGAGLERSLEHDQWVASHGESALRIEDLEVREGSEIAFEGVSLVLAPGGVGLVRCADEVARRALAAVVGGRLRPSNGRVVVGDHVLPDGTAAVQGSTAVLHAWDDRVSGRARVVIVDDPGERRWHRIEELHEEGRTVLVTGPLDLQVSAGVTIDAETTIRPASDPASASLVPAHRSTSQEA